MKENKKAILAELEKTINLTRERKIYLVLSSDEDKVYVIRGDNRERINVACDSGVAMIRDVMRANMFN